MEKLDKLYMEYVAGIGIGQFTFYRFAEWLIENYPEFATKLLAEAIKQITKDD